MRTVILPKDAAAPEAAEAVIRYGDAAISAVFPAQNDTETGSSLLLRLTKDGCGSLSALQTEIF